METEYTSMLVWTKAQPNLLSSKHTDIVAKALKRGVVFGLHSHLFGGRSLDTIVFRDYAAYRDYVQRSCAGDLYTLWSLPDLLDKQLALATQQSGFSSDSSTGVLAQATLERIQHYLGTPFNEIIYLAWETTTSETAMIHLDDSDGYETLLELLDQCRHPESFIHVFPFNVIDQPEHWLLQTKYPNDQGEVPIGGAY